MAISLGVFLAQDDPIEDLRVREAAANCLQQAVRGKTATVI